MIGGGAPQVAPLRPKVVVFCGAGMETNTRRCIERVAGGVVVTAVDVMTGSGSTRKRLEICLPDDTPPGRVTDLIARLSGEGVRALPWLPVGGRPQVRSAVRLPQAGTGLESAIQSAVDGVEVCDYYARGVACPYGSSCRYACY